MAPKAQIPNARKIAKHKAKLEKKYEKLYIKKMDAIVSKNRALLTTLSLCFSVNCVFLKGSSEISSTTS